MPVVSPVTIDAGDREWRELVAHVRLEVARQETAAIAREEAETGRTSALEPVAENIEKLESEDGNRLSIIVNWQS